MLHRPTRLVICVAILSAILTGCVGRSRQVEQYAAAMLHPRTTPRESLHYRQRLREMAPEAEPYLADAFFPIGLYDVPESALQEIAAAGFNLVANGGKDALYLRRAEAAGLKVIPYINAEKMARDVRRVKGRRSVFAWYLWDEPDLNDLEPEEYHTLAKQLHTLDESRPIFLTICSPTRYKDFIESADIFAPNPYPIRHKDAAKNNLRTVGLVIDRARAAAGDRPVWAILQAFWAQPTWPRNPTPHELRAMAFIALNHGVDGILYFSYKSGDRPITRHPILFAEIKRINGQVSALRGALLKKPLDRSLLGDAFHRALADGGIDYSVRTFRGAMLFIAVNPEPASKTIAASLSGLAGGKQIRELFIPGEEKAEEIVAGQKLRLKFHPFEVKIFWIE